METPKIIDELVIEGNLANRRVESSMSGDQPQWAESQRAEYEARQRQYERDPEEYACGLRPTSRSSRTPPFNNANKEQP